MPPRVVTENGKWVLYRSIIYMNLFSFIPLYDYKNRGTRVTPLAHVTCATLILVVERFVSSKNKWHTYLY